MKYLLILFTGLCTLCACGQKGPLVMTVKPPAISTPYPSPEDSSEPTTGDSKNNL